MSFSQLVSHFARAGLTLEVTERPLGGRGSADVLQLDIARPDAKVKFERYRLWPGALDNRVAVQGVDKVQRQLVLMVHEPRRAFQVRVGRGTPRSSARVISEDKWGWRWEEHFTENRKRHFLLGTDEAHLFIAQLPRPVSTVYAAHLALKGDEVRVAEAGALERTVRQGEWFFIPLRAAELAEVETQAARSPLLIHRGQGIAQAAGLRRGGRPHVAEEVLVLKGRVYVRGAVRHPDHATLTVRPWRRVVGNAERFEQPAGVLWVD